MSYRSYTSRPSAVGRYNSRSRFTKKRSYSHTGPAIDHQRFVAQAAPVSETPYEPEHHFADFELHDLLKANLTAKGYSVPSPVQDQAIPLGLAGKDVIGLAGTGTGKTAAFALPMLHDLLVNPGSAALIVAPTRELAEQIQAECRSIAKGSGLNGALLIGGSSMSNQLRDLRQRPRVVIGTPGRIKDHLERRTLKLDTFNLVALDEVDRMLDMGFVNDVRDILSHMASDRQSFFFSATMDNRVRGLIETFTNNPITVSIKVSAASENVNQDIVRYQSTGGKIDQLHEILINPDVAKVIVFDETQRSVERLNNDLVARGFKSDAIHGGKSQGQRQRALRKFKQNEVTILIATDVAARGIDVTDITHVINYSTPKSYDDYIHRIGRTGRAGRTGHALTFVPAHNK